MQGWGQPVQNEDAGLGQERYGAMELALALALALTLALALSLTLTLTLARSCTARWRRSYG